LVLEYHNGDSYATPESIAAFQSYNIIGTPTVIFDGVTRVIAGGPTQGLYNSYRGKVEAELLQPNSISIVATKTFDTNSLLINVKVTNTSSEAINGFQAAAVTYIDQGIPEFRYVVSDVSSSATTMSLTPGENKSFILTFKRPPSVVKVVVFLKLSGRIIQAALAS
jgi:hypothetical protein